jgi:ParB family transcriptional regulator, chromosome partitioning protein
LARSSRAPISFAAATAAARQVAPVVDRIADSLPVNAIRPSPRNARQSLTGIDELAASIQAHGLMQPIVVRPVANGYELIAGHRRIEAARLLGWTEIAVIVREESADEAYILTLVENLQREDLSPKEEASALEILVRERGWTTRQVGEAIKRSHVYVSRRLRVFEDDVLAPMVLSRGLTVSTAEELLRAPDPETRKELAGQAAEHQWTWGEARRAVAELGTDRSKWTGVAGHLRALINDSAEVDPATLTVADRKLVRRALAALRRLV